MFIPKLFVLVSSQPSLEFVKVDGKKPVPHGVAPVFSGAYIPDPVPWLPVNPVSNLNFNSLIKSISKNFSLLILHAAETEGKFPHLLSGPKYGEPSLLKVAVKR